MKLKLIYGLLAGVCFLGVQEFAVAQTFQDTTIISPITANISIQKPRYITASNSISGSSTNVNYVAGQMIRLTSGFKATGVQWFRAQVVAPEGRISSEEFISELPVNTGLSVYPNPFDNETFIEITSPKDVACQVNIYNVRGDKVKRLSNDSRLNSGIYKIAFNASDLPSGLYVCEYITSDKKITKRILKR